METLARKLRKIVKDGLALTAERLIYQLSLSSDIKGVEQLLPMWNIKEEIRIPRKISVGKTMGVGEKKTPSPHEQGTKKTILPKRGEAKLDLRREEPGEREQSTTF
jgi:hypothetical protein